MVAQCSTRDDMTTATREQSEDLKQLFRRDKRDGQTCTKWVAAPSPFMIPKIGFPTEAPPGTIEKALVLAARANREEDLFHPYDAKYDGDVRPLLWYLMKWEEKQKARGV